MKKLTILLFIPLVFACGSDDKKNDLDELNLNGKVKSLKETKYSALDALMLIGFYPEKQNYKPLDIVKDNVKELDSFEFVFQGKNQQNTTLEDKITVLMFLGDYPYSNMTNAFNIKELVYDKFKNFKNFQIVTIVVKDSEFGLGEVRKELLKYDELKYWYFASSSRKEIKNIYKSLRTKQDLDSLNFTNQVFIIDKLRNQRGRIDDSDNDNKNNNGLYSYNSLLVSEIKKKMNDDIRILLTEYRQKRKGVFNSNIRRM